MYTCVHLYTTRVDCVPLSHCKVVLHYNCVVSLYHSTIEWSVARSVQGSCIIFITSLLECTCIQYLSKVLSELVHISRDESLPFHSHHRLCGIITGQSGTCTRTLYIHVFYIFSYPFFIPFFILFFSALKLCVSACIMYIVFL
jgi:hypothetical protein